MLGANCKDALRLRWCSRRGRLPRTERRDSSFQDLSSQSAEGKVASDNLDLFSLKKFRKVGVSTKFLSAKFSFTPPPPRKGPKMTKNCTNQEKILKIDTFSGGGGRETQCYGQNGFMDIWAFLKIGIRRCPSTVSYAVPSCESADFRCIPTWEPNRQCNRLKGESLCPSTVWRGFECGWEGEYGSVAYSVERPTWEIQAEQYSAITLWEQKKPTNLKNFSRTPPLLDRNHPVDVSRWSRGHSVQSVCVSHINQSDKSPRP